ncbi:O-antigen ligase family protein [Fructobacillus sp. M2-14]|uniref:O-antigen ligase family protein n=1 Tax=Fructobacillus broussonetiae TaxID=2713173 RepID=A0ABS5R0B5_9LACO|nr:O-antigen ligase family protein [Fructobacillus broussonetiae]MBS9338874.1 O-antigen ligase family protein [Fructobacillus broussonetiae]
MVNFLLPITFFSKTYTYSLAEPTAMISVVVFTLIIVIQLFRYPNRVVEVIPSQKAFLLGGLFWVCQLVSMFLSYCVSGESKLTSGIIHSSIILLGWTLAVYLSWAVIQLTVRSTDDEKKFVKAGLVGLAFYLLFVIVPQFLVLFHFEKITSYVNFLASLFEQRWRTMGGYDIYAHGSYVTTQHRINGFEPEASYLANLLGVVYLPLLIGLTVSRHSLWKTTISKNKQLIGNTIFTFSVLLTLVLAKTTTGILTAGIAFILWMIWSKNGFRAFLFSTLILSGFLLFVAYFKVSIVHTTFNQFLFAKGGTDNRLGGTIALAITFLQHPLWGVGSGFTSFFIVQNVPEVTTHNFEYQHLYSQYGFPILSDFLGWLATFGIIIVIPALWLLIRLILKSYKMQLVYKNSSWEKAIHISFITMIVLAAFSSIFILKIYLWPYLLMFFFYRQHLIRLGKEQKQ